MSGLRRRLVGVVTSFGWYPLLLALVWFLEAYTVRRAEPQAALRSWIITLVVALALTLVTVRLLGRERGSLLAALLLVAVISVRSLLVALPFAAFVLLLLVERRWAAQGRLRIPWPRVHEAMTVFVAVMLVVQVARFVTVVEPAPTLSATAWSAQPLNGADRPDIYLILADAHGRQDVLSEAYGYDDEPFLAELRALDFDVASSSRANYFLTRFSLGSMFSASYLDRLNDNRDPDVQDDLARLTIQDNPAFPLLRRAGYEVTVISSGYEHLGLRSADQFVDTGQPNEFEIALMQNVAATGAWDLAAPGHDLEAIRARTRDELTALLRIAGDRSTQPRFVLAHLPTPHWPYVFSSSCTPAPRIRVTTEGIGRGGGSPEVVAAVRAQTTCLDSMLTEAIARLVELEPSAVVIVFSDHGPDEFLDWWQPDPVGLGERSANLFAARTPEKADLFPDDITLVNALPILFNAYLGTELPVLPNEIWFGPRPQDQGFVHVEPVWPPR